MHVTDKLTRPLTEAKYLNADNVDRYRSIIRIFYENYEKLRYWLYQEEVYEEMRRDSYFADYRMEQCQQDLAMLTEWKNLNTIQDTRKVASIEEFIPVSDVGIQCGNRAPCAAFRKSVRGRGFPGAHIAGTASHSCGEVFRDGRSGYRDGIYLVERFE